MGKIYLVEHASIEISKYDRKFKKFIILDDDEQRDCVLDIIRNNNDIRINPIDEYNTLEEAKKKASSLYYGVRGDLLRIEYDIIWENNTDDDTMDLIEYTYDWED